LAVNYAFVRLRWVGHLELMGREGIEQELRLGVLLIDSLWQTEMYQISSDIVMGRREVRACGWNCALIVVCESWDQLRAAGKLRSATAMACGFGGKGADQSKSGQARPGQATPDQARRDQTRPGHTRSG
jgi:hypothetical protein